MRNELEAHSSTAFTQILTLLHLVFTGQLTDGYII